MNYCKGAFLFFKLYIHLIIAWQACRVSPEPHHCGREKFSIPAAKRLNACTRGVPEYSLHSIYA
jgi:hypothetical protein